MKNDQGYFDELMKINDKMPSHADIIAEYWHHKAFKANEREINVIIEKVTNKINKKLTENELEKLDKEINKKTRPVFHFYYYDHWNEINEMIIKKYNYLFPNNPILKK